MGPDGDADVGDHFGRRTRRCLPFLFRAGVSILCDLTQCSMAESSLLHAPQRRNPDCFLVLVVFKRDDWRDTAGAIEGFACRE
jgi:hypothetical protein